MTKQSDRQSLSPREKAALVRETARLVWRKYLIAGEGNAAQITNGYASPGADLNAIVEGAFAPSGQTDPRDRTCPHCQGELQAGHMHGPALPPSDLAVRRGKIRYERIWLELVCALEAMDPHFADVTRMLALRAKCQAGAPGKDLASAVNFWKFFGDAGIQAHFDDFAEATTFGDAAWCIARLYEARGVWVVS